MTKFTCIPNLGKAGGGVQWDTEENKALAHFDKNGEFETDNKQTIMKLKKLGYKVVKEPEPDPDPKDEGKAE